MNFPVMKNPGPKSCTKYKYQKKKKISSKYYLTSSNLINKILK